MNEIDQIYAIPIGDINADLEFNTREHANLDLEELVISIKNDGQLEAGRVSLAWPEDQARHGKKYELNAGFRRFFAVMKAGKLEYKCYVSEALSMEERIKVNVKENMARKELNLWEECKPYIHFVRKGYTEAEIQEELGQSRSMVQVRCMAARMVISGIEGMDELARKKVLTYTNVRELYSLASKEDQQGQINEMLKGAEAGIKVKVSKNKFATKRDRATMLMERTKGPRQALLNWCNSVGIRWNRFARVVNWTNGDISDNVLYDFFSAELHDPTNDERLKEIFDDLESFKDNLGGLYIKLLTIKEEASVKVFEKALNGIPER